MLTAAEARKRGHSILARHIEDHEEFKIIKARDTEIDELLSEVASEKEKVKLQKKIKREEEKDKIINKLLFEITILEKNLEKRNIRIIAIQNEIAYLRKQLIRIHRACHASFQGKNNDYSAGYTNARENLFTSR